MLAFIHTGQGFVLITSCWHSEPSPPPQAEDRLPGSHSRGLLDSLCVFTERCGVLRLSGCECAVLFAFLSSGWVVCVNVWFLVTRDWDQSVCLFAGPFLPFWSCHVGPSRRL